MKNVYPIIFSFSNTKIPRKSVDTYKDFIKELFKENGHQDIEIPGGFPAIIRLKEEDKSNPTPDFLKSQIEAVLKSKKLITNDTEPKLNFLKDKIIVIDFLTKDAIDSKNEFHFLYFIDSLLEKSQNVDEPLKFVILSNRVYDETIFDSQTFFEKYVKTKQVLLYDNFGATYKDENNITELFRNYRKLIFGDANELFKRKLIGKVGHFKRKDSNDTHIRCHLFFYDGSHCEDELKLILNEKFFALNPDFIIYDCPESEWLVKSIQIAIPYYSTTQKPISVIPYSKDSALIKAIPKEQKGILIFDLIHKGNRLLEVYNHIKELNSPIVSNLNVLSILKATNSPITSSTNSTYQLTDTINEIKYDFVHKVFQKDYLQPNGCEMCNPYNIAETPKHKEILPSLQSYFFWLLCGDDDIGVGYNFPEINHPENRNPLATVPDFKKFLSIHGAYMAYKMKRLLEENKITNLEEYTFICPDEEGAKEVGKSIGYFFDAEIVRIDKKHIKQIIDEGMNRDKIIETFKEADWVSYLLEIEETGKSKSAIIFDEFALTNNTLKNYSTFIQKFGFQVSCYFPLFLFTDIVMPDNKPVFSLYNFNLYSAQPIFNGRP